MRKLNISELNRISNEEFKKTKKSNIVVVLDNIRSMHNVGSVFRTSDAFLVEKIYLTGITPQPPHRDIHKTALGATESVDWEYRKEPLSLVKELQENNYSLLAIEQTDQSIPLQNFEFIASQKYAFIFGNEVFGVSEDYVNNCDAGLEIPQYGTKHSLNISVCAGIILWNYVLNKLK